MECLPGKLIIWICRLFDVQYRTAVWLTSLVINLILNRFLRFWSSHYRLSKDWFLVAHQDRWQELGAVAPTIDAADKTEAEDRIRSLRGGMDIVPSLVSVGSTQSHALNPSHYNALRSNPLSLPFRNTNKVIVKRGARRLLHCPGWDKATPTDCYWRQETDELVYVV